jgi:hypothetical protein
MLKKITYFVFSTACLAPAAFLWSFLEEDFDMGGVSSWLAFIGVWAMTCGGLAALLSVFLPSVVRKPARSLWLRAAAIILLALVVALAAAGPLVTAVSEGIVWFVGSREAAATEVEPTTTASLSQPASSSEVGLVYLFDLVEEARGDLLARSVMSRAHPEFLVADTVDDELIVGLVLTERLSYQEMFGKGADEERRRKQLDLVLARLGNDCELAFAREESWRGARGLTQMTEATYLGLAAAYPEAALDTDSFRGRSDHLNAVKAMVLHLDEEAARASQAAAQRMRTSEWRRRALVAGYNTFSGRVYEAVEKCGNGWRSDACRFLPLETKRYVEMYLWVAAAI